MSDTRAPVTLGQIFDAVTHQKLRFLMTFSSILLLVVVGLILMPKQFGSEGKLFVQLGRPNVGLDPTTTTSGTISVSDSRETEIRSVVQLLSSYEVLSRVVEKVGAEKILKNKYEIPGWLIPSLSSGSPSGVGDRELTSDEVDTQKDLEKAVRKLGENLKIDSEKKTSVVSVYCKASTPFLARQLVKAILESYTELHISINTVKSKSFFETQFDEERKKLDHAMNTLRDFRNERKFLSVDGARNTLQQVIDKLETQRVDVGVDLAQSQKKIVELQKELAEIDERVERPTIGVERSSVEGANSEVMRLENELAKHLTTKKESHPRVVELQSQLKRMKAQMVGSPQDRTVTVNDLNPVHQQLTVSLIQARTDALAKEARLGEVNRKVALALAELEQLNQDQVTSQQMVREIGILDDYLGVFAKKRGEATVLEQLDQEHFSNVVVAQPASLMLKHVTPRGSIVLPLGIIFAGLGATAFCFLSYRSRREIVVDERDDLEQELELPILISLPRVPSTRASVR